MQHGCSARAAFLAALALSVSLVATALAGPGRLAASHAQRVATIGEAAPVFALPNVATGKNVTLASIEKSHKATVVIFIATRCPVSNAYNGRMADLAKAYGAKGVAFVGINSNQTEPATECASHATSNHLDFPVLKDAGSKVADLYDAQVTPEAYVVNAHGTLLYHGRIDDSRDIDEVQSHDLANALDEVLAGKPVSHASLRAFGCGIKR